MLALSVLLGAQTSCYDGYCYANYPLTEITPYESIDLTEINLTTKSRSMGDCESAWAFVVAGCAENAVLRLGASGLIQDGNWITENHDTIQVSVEYILGNDFANGHFCEGGDPIYNVQWQYDKKLTLEKEINFPYIMNEEDWKLRAPTKSFTIPTLEFYYPFQDYQNVLSRSTNVLKTPVVRLYQYSSLQLTPYNSTIQDQMKQLLSMGIALPVFLQIENDESFAYYGGDGTILHKDCPMAKEPVFDHHALLVGYGRKNGKKVWKLKNSYGSDWGNDGYFFLEQGRNSYCMEMQQFAFLPNSFVQQYVEHYDQPRDKTNKQALDEYFKYYWINDNPSSTIATAPFYDRCPPTHPYYLETKGCVTICPNGAYQLLSTGIKKCVDQCSNYFWEDTSTEPPSKFCLNLCVTPYQYIYLQQCYKQCPPVAPYVRRDSVQCTDQIQQCPVDQYLYQNKCYQRCPPAAEFGIEATASTSAICVTQCPARLYRSQAGKTQPFVCITSCEGAYWFNQTSQMRACVMTCQSDAPYYVVEGVCLSQCPATEPYVATNNQCVSRCLKFSDSDKACRAFCPNAKPFSGTDGKCYRCGKYTVQNGAITCVDRCPSGQTEFNGVCRHVPVDWFIWANVIVWGLIAMGISVWAGTKASYCCRAAKAQQTSCCKWSVSQCKRARDETVAYIEATQKLYEPL